MKVDILASFQSLCVGLRVSFSLVVVAYLFSSSL